MDHLAVARARLRADRRRRFQYQRLTAAQRQGPRHRQADDARPDDDALDRFGHQCATDIRGSTPSRAPAELNLRITSQSSTHIAVPASAIFMTVRVESPLAFAAKAAGGPNNTPSSVICVTSPLAAPSARAGATCGNSAHRPAMRPEAKKKAHATAIAVPKSLSV